MDRSRLLLSLALALDLILVSPWELHARAEETPGAHLGGGDADGDGVPDGSDCRPLDPDTWALPSEARTLVLVGGATTTLIWDGPTAPGATSVVYDVLRSTSPSDFSSAECVVMDQAGVSATDAAPVSGIAYYLVRSENLCGGSLGAGSSGSPRTARVCTRETGAPCASDGDCDSGFCTDGVCCASRCDGLCERCDVAGQAGSCTATPAGTDPDDECTADPPSTCGLTGQCSGTGSCQLHAVGTQCAPPLCDDVSQLSLADTCDGAGICMDGGVLDCAPFACAESACRTTCTVSSDCAPGFGCLDGACLASDGTPCSGDEDCLSGACCSNVCRNTGSDPSHCGACGVACTNQHGTTSCSGGTCLPVCFGLWGDCDGNSVNGCETALSTLANCGGCGVTCNLPNASETCSTGTCAISSCSPLFGNCDGLASNGCETPLTSLANCGGCGVACSLPNATESCSTGVCTLAGCNPGFSNCDGSSTNGCEVAHGTPAGTCATAINLGLFDGDRSCGFICASNTSWDLFATRTGRTSAWYRARVFEDSDCSATIEHLIELQSPAGVDYDLYVYRPCGTLVGSSTAGTGLLDSVVVSNADSSGSDDSFDYWIEVRYSGGGSCATWTLRLYGHDC